MAVVWLCNGATFELVGQTILQLTISQRFRPDEVWDNLTPHLVRAVAITELKGFARRNGDAGTHHWSACWSRVRAQAWAGVNEVMGDETMEEISEAFTTGNSGDVKIFMLGGERTRRIRTGRSATPRTGAAPGCVAASKGDYTGETISV